MTDEDTPDAKQQGRPAGQSNPDQPQGLSITEASQRLGCSTRTIHRWIAAGKLLAEVLERPQGKVYRVYLDAPDTVSSRGPEAEPSTASLMSTHDTDHGKKQDLASPSISPEQDEPEEEPCSAPAEEPSPAPITGTDDGTDDTDQGGKPGSHSAKT